MCSSSLNKQYVYTCKSFYIKSKFYLIVMRALGLLVVKQIAAEKIFYINIIFMANDISFIFAPATS